MSAVLLLAGTAEARALAGRLAAAGVAATASLAGATSDPLGYPLPLRRGGFGGAEGLAAWLRAAGTALLVDATHPHAAIMQRNAALAAAAAGVPRLRLLRPPWPVRPGWREVATAGEVASILPPGAVVLLTTGRKEIAPFAARTDCRFVLRTIEDAGALPRHVAPLRARPPFTRTDEVATLRRHAITHLVTKNAGGTGTAKLDAADALGIVTLVIRRPDPPPGPVVDTLEAAAAWLSRHLGTPI